MQRLLYIFLASVLLSACSKGAYDAWNDAPATSVKDPISAIVTVKQDAAGRIFFQLDEDTRVYPVNYDHPYKGLQRIICQISLKEEKSECYIHWMDEIEQGGGYNLPDTSEGYNGAGNRVGLDILDDWMTSVEDGFLTVHYSAWWGEGKIPHTLILYRSPEEENTFELTLIHFDNGDAALEKGDALIYFDINPLLPDTQGEHTTLTLKWTTLEGAAASKNFQFRSRQ